MSGVAEMPRVTAPGLTVDSVTAGYGEVEVLESVSLDIPAAAITALLGPNGAGKTTLLRVISGSLRPTLGRVLFNGEDISLARPSARAQAGLCMIPEGRGVFPNLTVAENLQLATPRWVSADRREEALAAFPILRDRLDQRAGTMSGGQQQMLALCRCFVTEPKIVLLDEVSMGLAPRIVDEIFVALEHLAVQGVALLLVEQYIHRALAMASHVHVLARGQLSFSGPPSEISEERLTASYLGGAIEAGSDAGSSV